jgi:alpha-glucosidase
MHKELPVLKYGSVKILKEDYNLLSFGRFNEKEQVVVVINNNNENKKVEIPVWETGISRSVDTTMTRILDSNAIAYDMEQKEYPVVAGYLELEMSPLEAIVLCRGCELPQKKDKEAAEKEGDASTVLNN